MELLFGEFIKQLIAAIMAIFMPFSALTPAAANAARSQITITTPPAVVQRAEEAAVVAEWDVSDTENDNVTMTYREVVETADTEDESFFDTVTSSITSLFTPMTAYAAQAVPTIVISGEGATEPLLFIKWLKADKFVPYYEDWCAKNGVNANGYYVAKDGIDEAGNIVGKRISAAQAHTGFATYEDMLDVYFPIYLIDIVQTTNKFWENYGQFAPRDIIIEDEVDRISFGAFAFCPNVKRITIATSAETFTVESQAFSGTSIERIEFPSGTQHLPSNIFESCTALKEVYLPGTIQSIANYVFNNMAKDSVIYCETEAVRALLIDPDANDGLDLQLDDEYAGEDAEYYDNYNSEKTTLKLYEER